MWESWANELLPKALTSSPKSKKSPNLVALVTASSQYDQIWGNFAKCQKSYVIFIVNLGSR